MKREVRHVASLRRDSTGNSISMKDARVASLCNEVPDVAFSHGFQFMEESEIWWKVDPKVGQFTNFCRKSEGNGWGQLVGRGRVWFRS